MIVSKERVIAMTKKAGGAVLLLALLLLSYNFGLHGIKTPTFPSKIFSSMARGRQQNCNYTLVDFNTILLALEKALNFFQNANELVLDAAVGTRVLEAQISLALHEYNGSLDTKYRRRLNQLLQRSSTLSETVLQAFMRNPTKTELKKMEQSAWVKSAQLWKMPKLNSWKSPSVMEGYFNDTTRIAKKNHFRDSFLGELSDTCIMQLFRCQESQIIERCKEYFFKTPGSSYTLNHQIIYVILAEQNGCHKRNEYEEVFEGLGGWQQFRKDLCGKAWFLANVIASKGFTPRYYDLFTEQVAICSLAGYPNFLKREWLYKILSWQAPGDEGCFPLADLDNRMLVTLSSDDDYEDVESPLNISRTHLRVRRYSRYTFTKKRRRTTPRTKTAPEKGHRPKRTEQIVKSETGKYCLTHLTTMGVMVLSIHLRHLMETCTDQLLTKST